MIVTKYVKRKCDESNEIMIMIHDSEIYRYKIPTHFSSKLIYHRIIEQPRLLRINSFEPLCSTFFNLPLWVFGVRIDPT